MGEEGVEVVEAALPLLAEGAEPAFDVGQRAADHEAPRAALGVPPRLDEPGLFEDAQVFGDRGLPQPERRRQLRDGGFSLGKAREDRPPGGIGEGREGVIEGGLHSYTAI